MVSLVFVAPLDIVLNTEQGCDRSRDGLVCVAGPPTCSGFCIGSISELEQSKTATYSKLRISCGRMTLLRGQLDESDGVFSDLLCSLQPVEAV
jgi:hypothetical protein